MIETRPQEKTIHEGVLPILGFVDFVPFQSPENLGFALSLFLDTFLVINSLHPLADWLTEMVRTIGSSRKQHGFFADEHLMVINSLVDAFKFRTTSKQSLLHDTVHAWAKREDLPTGLIPPDFDLSDKDFRLTD